MPCESCKTCVLKTVAKLEGINAIAVDAEKGTLTVVGEVDAVQIVQKLRKIGKAASIDSVGPNKEEEKEKEKEKDKEKEKEKEKEKDVCKEILPLCCRNCQPATIRFVSFDEPNYCRIL